MKILLIHRYFWPDTPPYAAMLRLIARRLVEDGHDVTVFSSQPSYKKSVKIPRQPSCEQIDGFTIRRFPLLPENKSNIILRTINVLIFILGILCHVLLSGKYKVVMISTMPPVMAGWAGRAAARLNNAFFIYHCMDIHPEAGKIAGFFKDGLVFKWLKKIDMANCNKADAVIVLSEDMADTLKKREKQSDDNVHIINNFTLPAFDAAHEELPDSLRKKSKVFRVLFAGNLGRYQGLETVIDAADALRDFSDIEFVFLGDGAAKSDLQKRAGDLVSKTVHFFPHQPVAMAKKVMQESDLGLITLVPDIYKVAYPSKTMTYLSQGCPLLVMVEQESELSRFVLHEGVGYVSPYGDVPAMKSVILEAYTHRAGQHILKEKAQRVGEDIFGADIAMEKWSELFRNIGKRRGDDV